MPNSKGNKGSKPDVRAAGGLVWRPAVIGDPSGATDVGVEVVLIHRPRYDDWSFPKGKLDRGESWEDAARREVEEETGLRCELGEERPPATWTPRAGTSWCATGPCEPSGSGPGRRTARWTGAAGCPSARPPSY
jgi:8-oxo-dGTP pyrophosphatase MutT (NUDIX family)